MCEYFIPELCILWIVVGSCALRFRTRLHFLGSGPEGDDDLCFHTGEISSPPPPSSPSSPPLKAQNQASRPGGSNPSLKAQIPALRLKSQYQGSNPSLEGSNPSLKA